MKGSRMPRISEETFKNLKIPLPPLSIQNRIAKQIQNLKNEIATFKRQAEENRAMAIKEFEEEVFDR